MTIMNDKDFIIDEYNTLVKYKGNDSIVKIPDGVTSVGICAFFRCRNLTSITIPDGVKSIEGGAFSGCSSLTSITIPNTVTKIDEDTFSGCTNLESVTIPDSVIHIGSCAFYQCKSLKSITIPESVTTIGYNVFDNRSIEMIYCAKGSRAERHAQKNGIPYSYIEQDKKKENKQQTVIKETERTPAKPIKNGDIVQLTNFDNLYGMVSGMNEDHIFVLDCNGDERRVKRSEGSVLKPVKSSPAIKKVFCEMLDQIEMRQQIRDDIYNLEEQESECDSKIADNTTLLRSLLSGKGKDNCDIER